MTGQLKYLQIDYVLSPTQAQGIPWVIVAVDPGNPNATIQILEVEECKRWLDPENHDYLDALVVDWNMTLNKAGDELLESLSGLAIGPLRASTSGECAREDLDVRVLALNDKIRNNPPQ